MRIVPNSKSPLILLFLLAAAAITSFAAENATDPNNFFRVDSVDGKLQIWAGKIVDWKNVAPTQYKQIDYRNPPASLLNVLKEKRDMFDTAVLDYYLPIPDQLRKSRYYLISSDGIEPLKLESLHGIVDFRFKWHEDSLEMPPMFSGYIVATLDGNKSPKDGFALRSEQALIFTVTKVTINVGDYPSLLDESHDRIALSLEKGSTKWGIAHSFGFQFSQDHGQYAFVKWDFGNDYPCGFNASILTLGKAPHEVIWNSSGCDI